jgi:hypothetical protein
VLWCADNSNTSRHAGAQAFLPRRKIMAKGQQSNKMVKKPKKDTSPPKPVSADAVRPTVVTVVPVRGKLKNAPR